MKRIPARIIALPLILWSTQAPTMLLAVEKPAKESSGATLLRPPEYCSAELSLKYVIRTAQGHYLSKFEMVPNDDCERMLEKGEGAIEVTIIDAPSDPIKRIIHVNGDIDDAFFMLPRPGKAVGVTYVTLRPFTTEALAMHMTKPGKPIPGKGGDKDKDKDKDKGKEEKKPAAAKPEAPKH